MNEGAVQRVSTITDITSVSKLVFERCPGEYGGSGCFGDGRGDRLVDEAVVLADEGSGAIPQVRTVRRDSDRNMHRHIEVEPCKLAGNGAGECLGVGAEFGVAQIVESFPQCRNVIERILLCLLAGGERFRWGFRHCAFRRRRLSRDRRAR